MGVDAAFVDGAVKAKLLRAESLASGLLFIKRRKIASLLAAQYPILDFTAAKSILIIEAIWQIFHWKHIEDRFAKAVGG